MNSLQAGKPNPRTARIEADLRDCVKPVFRGWPMLRGFSVRNDLYIVEVTCFPGLDATNTTALCEELSGALLALVDEQPEAAELIRGRTFVRVLS